MAKDRTIRTPSQTAKLVGIVMLGAIFATLAIFLVITWLNGDNTNNLKERQPSPSPANSSATPRSGG